MFRWNAATRTVIGTVDMLDCLAKYIGGGGRGGGAGEEGQGAGGGEEKYRGG